MNQKEKAPCFRGHVRKSVSPFGVTTWVSEVRTPAAVITGLERTPTVNEAIARAIQTASTSAPVGQVLADTQPLRQAA